MEGEVGGEEALCLQVTFVYAGGGGAKEKKNEGNWVFELCTSVQEKKKTGNGLKVDTKSLNACIS